MWWYSILLVPMLVGHVLLVLTFLIIGGLAWIFGRFTDASNCYFWAVSEWVANGGGLVLSLSRKNRWKFIRWVHFQHIKDGVVREYVPAEPHIRRRMPPPLFRGHVRIVSRRPQR